MIEDIVFRLACTGFLFVGHGQDPHRIGIVVYFFGLGELPVEGTLIGRTDVSIHIQSGKAAVRTDREPCRPAAGAAGKPKF